jgi:hypothetical protein
MIMFWFGQKCTKSSIAAELYQENSMPDLSASLEISADILQSPRLCLDNHSGRKVVATGSHHDQPTFEHVNEHDVHCQIVGRLNCPRLQTTLHA